MGWLKDLQDAVKKADAASKQPRDLTSADRLGWDEALNKRDRGAERTIESVRTAIKYKNPIRWANLQRDLRWVQREMKKLGLNPEDARWLL